MVHSAAVLRRRYQLAERVRHGVEHEQYSINAIKFELDYVIQRIPPQTEPVAMIVDQPSTMLLRQERDEVKHTQWRVCVVQHGHSFPLPVLRF